MKKLIFLIITIMCVMSSFISIFIYNITTKSEIAQFDYSIVTDDNYNQLANESNYYNKIEEAANNNGIVIARTTYDSSSNSSSTKTVMYTNSKDSDLVSQSFTIKSGHFLDKNTTNNQYLSSKNTSDSNQIGMIERFDGSNTLEIRPFSAQANKNLPSSFTCYIYSDNKDAREKFVDDLNKSGIQNNGVRATNNAFMDQSVIMMSTLPLIGIAFACLYVLFIVSLLYYLISNYKRLAICKLFGRSNFNLLKNLYKTIGIAFLFGELVNIIITTIFLCFYNSFAFYFKYMAIWIIVQYILVFLTAIITLLSMPIIKRIKVSQMIKNRKPIRANKVLNMVVKVIFSFVVIAVFCMGINNSIYLINNNPNIDKWEQTKNLANIAILSGSSTVTSDMKIVTRENYDKSTKILDFIRLQNDKGGMIVSPSDHYDEAFSWQTADIPDYYPEKKSIIINNNYLLSNKIVDLNGNAVNFPDQNSDIVNLLVPEKYKNDEETIKKLYQDEIKFDTFSIDDQYVRAKRGTNSQNDPIEHDDVPINITYVKDNQSYFTYNPYYCKDTNNEIKDNPIAIVYNNKTTPKVLCISKLVSEGYFVKVDDMDHIEESVQEDVKKTGTQSILIFQSVYRKVDQQMSKIRTELLLQSIIMGVAITVLVMILLTTIFNYLEQNKLINAVKRMHGYSFYNRHYSYFCTLVLTWTVIFVGISIFSVLLKLPFEIVKIGAVSAGLLLFESAISLPLIKIKELKKTKDILKGD